MNGSLSIIATSSGSVMARLKLIHNEFGELYTTGCISSNALENFVREIGSAKTISYLELRTTSFNHVDQQIVTYTQYLLYVTQQLCFTT